MMCMLTLEPLPSARARGWEEIGPEGFRGKASTSQACRKECDAFGRPQVLACCALTAAVFCGVKKLRAGAGHGALAICAGAGTTVRPVVPGFACLLTRYPPIASGARDLSPRMPDREYLSNRRRQLIGRQKV